MNTCKYCGLVGDDSLFYIKQSRVRCRQCKQSLAKDYNSQWKKDNRGRVNERKQITRDREKDRAYAKVYAKNRKAERAQAESKRRAKHHGWGNVQAFYTHARLMTEVTGELYTVDHIDPLTHSLVCGLHCPANLRVIKGSDNFQKKNKFEPYSINT